MAVLTITKDNFEQEVLQSDKPVLLDFWASWCGPCRMVSPIVDEIAEERADIKVGKINVDEQGALAQEFGVMSIPTLVVIKDGQPANKAVGAMPGRAPETALSGDIAEPVDCQGNVAVKIRASAANDPQRGRGGGNRYRRCERNAYSFGRSVEVMRCGSASDKGPV